MGYLARARQSQRGRGSERSNLLQERSLRGSPVPLAGERTRGPPDARLAPAAASLGTARERRGAGSLPAPAAPAERTQSSRSRPGSCRPRGREPRVATPHAPRAWAAATRRAPMRQGTRGARPAARLQTTRRGATRRSAGSRRRRARHRPRFRGRSARAPWERSPDRAPGAASGPRGLPRRAPAPMCAPSPRSRPRRSGPGPSPCRALARACGRSPPAGAGTPAPRHARARGGGRARAGRRRLAPARVRSFALGVQQRVAAEAFPVGEDEPPVRLVVVPDLQPRLARGGLALLDLVRRPVTDVAASHVRAPAWAKAQEMLLRVAHAPEELDLELVPRGLRRRVPPLPEHRPHRDL